MSWVLPLKKTVLLSQKCLVEEIKKCVLSEVRVQVGMEKFCLTWKARIFCMTFIHQMHIEYVLCARQCSGGSDGAPTRTEIPTLLGLHCCVHVRVCICVCVCWGDIQHTEWWQSEFVFFFFLPRSFLHSWIHSGRQNFKCSLQLIWVFKVHKELFKLQSLKCVYVHTYNSHKD